MTAGRGLTNFSWATNGAVLDHRRNSIDAALLKLSDWLWLTLVSHPAKSWGSIVEHLTLMHAVWLVAFLCFAYGFGQIFTADLAMFFALDAATYVEVVAAITIMVVQGRAVTAALVLREGGMAMARKVGAALSRLAPRAREQRDTRATRKAPPPEDGHAWSGALAAAW